MSGFLQWIDGKHFGAMNDRRVGPFAPGLNVAFGPNEAGKTTAAALVPAVLFGFNDMHGVANTYQPTSGERAGALVFCDDGDDGEGDRGEGDGGGATPNASGTCRTLSRTEDGPLVGADDTVKTVDRATFSTMFTFNSEELLGLHTTSTVAASLLAAGSGTATSPAEAFDSLERRIAELTLLSADQDSQSILNQEERLDALRSEVQLAGDANEERRQQARDLREIEESQRDVVARIQVLSDSIDNYEVTRDRLGVIDQEAAALTADCKKLQDEREALEEISKVSSIDPGILSMDSVQEASLKASINDLEARQERIQRMVETAQQNRVNSRASFESLQEMDDEEAPRSHRIAVKGSQAAVSIVPTVVFVGLGVLLFLHGRSIGSLSFTVFGCALVALAFLLAAAGAVLLSRPPRSDHERQARLKDAQWIMLQDQKKLDGLQEESEALQKEICDFLVASGLGAAEGSLRKALVLLEEAEALRTEISASDQRRQAVELRIANLEESLRTLAQERETLWDSQDLLPEEKANPAATLNTRLSRAVEQREALQDMLATANLRLGELKAALDISVNDCSFDIAKQSVAFASTALEESKRELVKLLLAKRMLERALATWESKEKPQVYALASDLLREITHGRWTEISVARSGSIVAVDKAGNAMKPRHLSLGTRQQLYLALRVAMLLNAGAVGNSLPVLADDILVHFDDERRAGAARILARLAEKRQVIVFTCHQETVDALKAASSKLHIVNL